MRLGLWLAWFYVALGVAVLVALTIVLVGSDDALAACRHGLGALIDVFPCP